ncbi:hypothetical protein ABH922_004113 [Rhodococcus sp. 27YEA15]|uniref:hypothetical protein n=1 Tax=Rhodococcus sp. 27YEA15 TaxID=3156259 RepID=UPI003C7C6341
MRQGKILYVGISDTPARVISRPATRRQSRQNRSALSAEAVTRLGCATDFAVDFPGDFIAWLGTGVFGAASAGLDGRRNP